LTTPSSRSWLSTGLAVALLAAFWFFLAPKQLGGPATYVITHGGSMAKAGYHSGDLAILHGSSAYKVNDIAGYKDTGGFVVLHRIIRIDGSHYIF